MTALVQRTWKTVSGLGCGVLVGWGQGIGKDERQEAEVEAG